MECACYFELPPRCSTEIKSSALVAWSDSAISVYQCVSAVQKNEPHRVPTNLCLKLAKKPFKVADFALLNHYILSKNDEPLLNVLLELM